MANQSSSDFFYSLRGLRIVFYFGTATEIGFYISHISLSDYTTLLCNANAKQILYIRLVLTYFQAIIGLRVNLSNTVGNIGSMRELADILCCKIGSLPITDHGMPSSLVG